jgi:hypothetical protein
MLLASAATSPIAWGIILAYVIAKPLGRSYRLAATSPCPAR